VHGLFQEPYYPRRLAPNHLLKSQAEQRVMEVLSSAARDTVVETSQRWNTALRAEIRGATALTLRSGTSAPVAVASDHEVFLQFLHSAQTQIRGSAR
jgi:hypothetical protein